MGVLSLCFWGRGQVDGRKMGGSVGKREAEGSSVGAGVDVVHCEVVPK
jgi:hypothetical protein